MKKNRDGFFARAAKGADLIRIAQASIGPNGKPDIWKAQRLAKLKGFTSREDHMQLVAIIQSMGGFDKEPATNTTNTSYRSTPAHDEYAWRNTCEDGSEWGIDPEDYETESDYEEVLEEAMAEWEEV